MVKKFSIFAQRYIALKPCSIGAFLLISLIHIPTTYALNTMTTKALAAHCTQLKSAPESINAQFCVGYIQGFIDGAIAIDDRVMLNNTESSGKKSTFTERAMRTRLPGINARSQLAEFCLDRGLPIRSIVDTVIEDLTANLATSDIKAAGDKPAMEAVYQSLIKNYPCK